MGLVQNNGRFLLSLERTAQPDSLDTAVIGTCSIDPFLLETCFYKPAEYMAIKKSPAFVKCNPRLCWVNMKTKGKELKQKLA